MENMPASQSKKENDMPKDKKKKKSYTLQIIALVFSFIAIMISLLPYRRNVEPIGISGFGVLRGYNTFPSDHLVLPLQWKSDGINDVLLKNPTLIIEDITEGIENPETIVFTAAGEVTNISAKGFSDTTNLEYGNSFVLKGRTLSRKNILFHYEKWWNRPNEKDPNATVDKNYWFRFRSNSDYKVTLRYQIDLGAKEEVELFILHTYDRIDDLECCKESPDWFDFFYIN